MPSLKSAMKASQSGPFQSVLKPSLFSDSSKYWLALSPSEEKSAWPWQSKAFSSSEIKIVCLVWRHPQFFLCSGDCSTQRWLTYWQWHAIAARSGGSFVEDYLRCMRLTLMVSHSKLFKLRHLVLMSWKRTWFLSYGDWHTKILSSWDGVTVFRSFFPQYVCVAQTVTVCLIATSE